MIKVGITGGIGSGKSYICNIFKELGVKIYDADKMAKQLMVSNRDVIKNIKHNFGTIAYLDNGELNRDHLSSVVFSNSDKLAILNSIVHPALLTDFASFAEESERRGEKIVIMEAAILIESGFDQFMDKILVINADYELRIKRATERDNVDIEKVKSRMSAQINDEERNKKADFIIFNNKNDLLLPQILEFLRKIDNF